jgi:hypothetical protein
LATDNKGGSLLQAELFQLPSVIGNLSVSERGPDSTDFLVPKFIKYFSSSDSDGKHGTREFMDRTPKSDRGIKRWTSVAQEQPALISMTKGTIRRTLVSAVQVNLVNVMVIIPCLVIGLPLVWHWCQLDNLDDVDEIWTAHDADLRETDISYVGASGVALLRRHSDRKFGVLLSIVGIMLQIVFLYYIAVYSIRRAWQPVVHESPLALVFCSMFCNSMTCCSSFITGIKAWDTKAPKGYENLHHALVGLDSFSIPTISVVVGNIYLCTSKDVAGLVFSATAMAFVCRINMQISGLMSWSLSGHGGRAFQPANVCIKDSVNTMRYAYYSLICATVVTLLMLPLAIHDLV